MKHPAVLPCAESVSQAILGELQGGIRRARWYRLRVVALVDSEGELQPASPAGQRASGGAETQNAARLLCLDLELASATISRAPRRIASNSHTSCLRRRIP